jgi:hypothetical protein
MVKFILFWQGMVIVEIASTEGMPNAWYFDMLNATSFCQHGIVLVQCLIATYESIKIEPRTVKSTSHFRSMGRGRVRGAILTRIKVD